MMLACGILLLAVGTWCLVTSGRRSTARPAAAAAGTPAVQRRALAGADDEGETCAVVQALRSLGWYVANDVRLPHAEIDFVAVGPAGVLAMQVQWTNRPDRRGHPAARARIGAQQLRKILARKELAVEVVPVVLAFGPGLTDDNGGVKVVDNVAILNGYAAAKWTAELDRRTLLPDDVVCDVRCLLADIREADSADALHMPEPALPLLR